MIRKSVVALGLIIVVAGGFLFAACDEEPTQAEAEEHFCDSAGDAVAALRDLRKIDKDSTLEEYEHARDQATATYAAMIEASAGVTGARLNDVQGSREELQQAIDDVPKDSTFSEALDSVDDEIETLARDIGELLNNVNCGLEPGGDSQSDE